MAFLCIDVYCLDDRVQLLFALMTTGVPSCFSLTVKVEEGRKDGRRKRRGEDER